MLPVLVPRREDGGRRDDVWNLLRREVWGDFEVFEGHHNDGPFNRSAALNTASDLAGDWELAIIADADSFVHRDQLDAAVALSRETGRLVIPYSRWVNVEVDEVEDFVHQNRLLYRKHRTIYQTTVSSVLVVPRGVWDAVNGFDERFVGWGWEDCAFMTAVEVVGGGSIRLEGSVYHMAHDRPEADSNRVLDPGYIANTNHWRKYKLAKSSTEVKNLIIGNRAKLSS